MNNKKIRNSNVLNTASLSGFAAMTVLITSAYMTDKKIHVGGDTTADGLLYAVAVRVGAKSKISNSKKIKPSVRLNGLTVDAH